MSERRWRNLLDLANSIAARAHAGKQVLLRPDTASVVAAQLATAHTKPSRDEIARLICRQREAARCEEPCFECRGRANAIVRAYGGRLDDLYPEDPGNSAEAGA